MADNTYERQSTFSNGDAADANVINAEFDQLALAFDNDDGHKHDGETGPLIELIKSDTTSIELDSVTPGSHMITFTIEGAPVLTWNSASPFDLMQTTKITHVPDGGSEVQLNTYLDGLEIAVGDAAADAASAAEDAERAENAAMVVGVPVYIADAGSYTITNSMEAANLVFEGDGTLNLPTTLVKGRRFTVRLSFKATSTKLLTIANPSFSMIGELQTISAGDNIQMSPGDLIVLEVVSATELEVL
jgi:hypothetical protein